MYKYFFKKGLFKGGHNVAKRGTKKMVTPPYTNALLRPWLSDQCELGISISSEKLMYFANSLHLCIYIIAEQPFVIRRADSNGNIRAKTPLLFK